MTKVIFTVIGGVLFLACVAAAMLWPWQTEGVVKSTDYNQYWVDITFEDGRKVRFRHPPAPIYPGKYYTVRYNNIRMVYSVEEK